MFSNLRNFVHDNETTIFLVVLIAGVIIGAAMVGVSHAVWVK